MPRRKSRMTSFVLTVIFGPLGLIYSTVVGAVLLSVLAILTFPTIVGPIACWVFAIAVGDHATYKHNQDYEEWLTFVKPKI